MRKYINNYANKPQLNKITKRINSINLEESNNLMAPPLINNSYLEKDVCFDSVKAKELVIFLLLNDKNIYKK